jgi:hypothetical protein
MKKDEINTEKEQVKKDYSYQIDPNKPPMCEARRIIMEVFKL